MEEDLGTRGSGGGEDKEETHGVGLPLQKQTCQICSFTWENHLFTSEANKTFSHHMNCKNIHMWNCIFTCAWVHIPVSVWVLVHVCVLCCAFNGVYTQQAACENQMMSFSYNRARSYATPVSHIHRA